MSAIQAVLLDIDGTLVDSNDAHAQAWVKALEEFGYPAKFDRIRRLIGKGGDKLLPEVTGIEKDSEQGKKVSERRTQIFMHEYLPHIRAFPDTLALLKRMHEGGLRLVVATSANEEEMSALLKTAGATGLLYERASSTDAKNSKPDPDIVQVALKKAEARADASLFLGDTPYDVEAGRRAGVDVVALRCGGWGDEDLRGAIAVYDDPFDLLAHYDESPFARNGQKSRVEPET